MSVDEIRRRAEEFQKKIYWRNARNYVAALVGVVGSGYLFWYTSDALTRVGDGLMIAGFLFLVWDRFRRGSAQPLPANLGLASGFEFYRRELERQRDFLRRGWSSCVGVMIPGFAVLTLASARTNPNHLRHIGLSLALGLFVLVSVLAWVGNQQAARKLQSGIDELNALEGQR